jgi:hypothetical protein
MRNCSAEIAKLTGDDHYSRDECERNQRSA